MRIIDLSLGIEHGSPTFPLDPKTGVLVHHTIKSMKYNITQLILSTHLGTHLDAPFHFFDDGRTVDALDLAKCIGPAHVIKLGGIGPGGEITVGHLKPHEKLFRSGAKIILNTGWSKQFPQDRYFQEMPGITVDGAKWIAEKEVGMLGLDLPGVNPTDWEEVHKIFLSREIVIVEGLAHLDEIRMDEVFFIALPLKLKGRDGSPVRAVAVEGLSAGL
jgi:kynurenine formamidase